MTPFTKAVLTFTATVICSALIAVIMVNLVLKDNDTEQAAAAPNPHEILAKPRSVDEPRRAIPVTPDPTREIITQQLTAGFQNRITDLIYLAAVGSIAESHPERLADHLAHRDNHDACLLNTLEAAGAIAETQATEDELIDELTTCLQQESASWEESPPVVRSLWMLPILEAAGRAHNPARHYGALHPNADSSESYREMAAVYSNCEQLAVPHADLIATHHRSDLAVQAIEQAVNEIGNCMVSATGAAWPEPTPTRSPTPTPKP